MNEQLTKLLSRRAMGLEELAEATKVSRATIHRVLQKNKNKFFNHGGKWYTLPNNDTGMLWRVTAAFNRALPFYPKAPDPKALTLLAKYCYEFLEIYAPDMLGYTPVGKNVEPEIPPYKEANLRDTLLVFTDNDGKASSVYHSDRKFVIPTNNPWKHMSVDFFEAIVLELRNKKQREEIEEDDLDLGPEWEKVI